MPAIPELLKWVGIIIVICLVGWFLLEVLEVLTAEGGRD